MPFLFLECYLHCGHARLRVCEKDSNVYDGDEAPRSQSPRDEPIAHSYSSRCPTCDFRDAIRGNFIHLSKDQQPTMPLHEKIFEEVLVHYACGHNMHLSLPKAVWHEGQAGRPGKMKYRCGCWTRDASAELSVINECQDCINQKWKELAKDRPLPKGGWYDVNWKQLPEEEHPPMKEGWIDGTCLEWKGSLEYEPVWTVERNLLDWEGKEPN